MQMVDVLTIYEFQLLNRPQEDALSKLSILSKIEYNILILININSGYRINRICVLTLPMLV